MSLFQNLTKSLKLKLSKNREYEEISSYTSNINKTNIFNKPAKIVILLLSLLGVALISVQIIQKSKFEKTSSYIKSTLEKSENDYVISTRQGSIRGKKMLSRDGREFLAFLGVPYAKPPIGNLRFSAPEEDLNTWEGVLNATKFQNQCSQLSKNKKTGEYITVGSEDCLYLNIFAPKNIDELKNLEKDKKLPVIFYVHGGINNGNGSQYGPDYILDEDVILVHVHFRLHVFANLNTEDIASSGNYGLKDQVMALKWLQKNIYYFGGNPKKITMFGNSSGSMHISLHLISQMSTGLFHQAILQSGTFLIPDRFSFEPKKNAYELGAQMGCEKNLSTFELVDCLRKIDVKKLTRAVKDMIFWFSIERNVPKNISFLAENPVDLLEQGKVNKVPTIQGVTSAESIVAALGIFLASNGDYPLTNYNNSWDNFLKNFLNLSHAQHPEKIIKRVHEFYFNKSQNLTRDNAQELVNLASDRQFVHTLHSLTLNQLKVHDNSTPIYLYVVTKSPEKGYANSVLKSYGAEEGTFGVSHADDVQFFFPSGKFPKISRDSKYYSFSKYLIRKWANFATTGDPNKESDEAGFVLKNDDWYPVKSINDKNQWFELGDDPKMFEPIFTTRMKFWDQFELTDLYP